MYTDGGNQGNVQGRTRVIIKATIPSALLNLVKLAWRWSGGIGTRCFFLCTRIIYIGTYTHVQVRDSNIHSSSIWVYIINSINIVHWKQVVVYIDDVTMDPFSIIQNPNLMEHTNNPQGHGYFGDHLGVRIRSWV